MCLIQQVDLRCVHTSTVEFRTFCRLGGSLSTGKPLFSLNRISATWVQSKPKGRNSTVVIPSTVEFRTFCRLGGSLSSGKSLFSLNRISATWVQSKPKGRNSTVVNRSGSYFASNFIGLRSLRDPVRLILF